VLQVVGIRRIYGFCVVPAWFTAAARGEEADGNGFFANAMRETSWKDFEIRQIEPFSAFPHRAAPFQAAA
jgi:hypothetical protein